MFFLAGSLLFILLAFCVVVCVCDIFFSFSVPCVPNVACSYGLPILDFFFPFITFICTLKDNYK